MRIALTAALLFVASPALADDSDGSRPIEIAPITEIDFQEVDVNARLHGPSMQIIAERAGARFTPFVTLRAHFSDEMARSTREF